MKRLFVVLLFLLLTPTIVFANSAIDSATNTLRASAGLAPLVVNAQLHQLAKQRAYEIQPPNFNHSDLSSRIPLCFSGYGENIQYRGGDNTPIDFYNGWFNSPPHRNNMLGDWTHTGSALVQIGSYWYGVQIFIKATCNIPNTALDLPYNQAAIITGLVLATVGIRWAARNKRHKVAKYAIIKKDRGPKA